MFFAQKLSNLGPVLNKPLPLKRVSEGTEPQLSGDFSDFAAKMAILTPFITFRTFQNHINNYNKIAKVQKSLKDLNCLAF